MRILLYELRKIWSLKIVAAIALLCAMYFLIFMSFYIDHSPNNPDSAADFAYCSMLTQKYGATLEPDEFQEFLLIRDDLIKEADDFISGNPVLTGLEIQNYDELQAAIERLSKRDATEEEQLEMDLIFEEFYFKPDDSLTRDTKILASDPSANWVGNNITAIDHIAGRYASVLDPSILLENGVRGIEHLPGADDAQRRYEDMVKTEEFRAIIPGETVMYTAEYMRQLGILLVLSSLVLLAPLLTADRIKKVHHLQYSTRYGRNIVKKQFVAMLLSSAILTTALIIVFGAIYSVNGVQVFWNSYVSSFNSYYYLSVPVTFGQYTMIMIGLVYLLGLAVSTIAFALSRFCSNYIALIAGIIPTVIAMSMLCVYIVFNMPLNAFHAETGLALFEPIVCFVLLVIGIAISVLIVRRERKIDIV